jgi:hypothetical protein
MTDRPVETKAPKLESIRTISLATIREDAHQSRVLAAQLFAAELAGDWAAVSAVRKVLVETAMVLQAAADKYE